MQSLAAANCAAGALLYQTFRPMVIRSGGQLTPGQLAIPLVTAWIALPILVAWMKFSVEIETSLFPARDFILKKLNLRQRRVVISQEATISKIFFVSGFGKISYLLLILSAIQKSTSASTWQLRD